MEPIERDRTHDVHGQGRGGLRSRGAIGGAVARAFAREGAEVFLAGRRPGPVEVVAKESTPPADRPRRRTVDALDEQAVDEHLRSVVDEGGPRRHLVRRDRHPERGRSWACRWLELDAERFAEPIAAYTTSYFLTARLAARRMMPNRSGVIMTVTALHSRTGIPLVGGYGPAMAAKEALTRDLSAELAPHGIRVVGLRPQAMPETAHDQGRVRAAGEASGLTWAQWQERLASRTHPRRLMTLTELADAAAFLASDRASGLTGTTVNLTMGSLDD